MFEISWSELLILAVVTLIFVGPKDLPKFLNTMGRYAGMVRRQAAEFRAQFDEAMRQAELEALKKEVSDLQSGINNSIQDADKPKPAPAAEPVEAPPLQPRLPLGRSPDEIAASGAKEEADKPSPPGNPSGKAGA